MKISDKIRDLVNRAQKVAYPGQDKHYIKDFVTLTVSPIDGGYFQVWMDKWHLNGTDSIHHEGMLFDDFWEGSSLAEALSLYETDILEPQEDTMPEQTIEVDGHTYKLVK